MAPSGSLVAQPAERADAGGRDGRGQEEGVRGMEL